VALPSDLSVSGDGNDGAPGPVLGDEVGRPARGGDHNDGLGLALDRGVDGCDGRGVGGVGGGDHQTAQVDEQLAVVEHRFGLAADVGHGGHALQGVVTLGSLTRQHHAVGAVQDSVGHVGTLGAGRAGLLHHRL